MSDEQPIHWVMRHQASPDDPPGTRYFTLWSPLEDLGELVGIDNEEGQG